MNQRQEINPYYKYEQYYSRYFLILLTFGTANQVKLKIEKMTSLFVPIFRRIPRRDIELLKNESQSEIFKTNKDNIQYM